MKFKIVFTKTFEKSLKKLTPAEQKQVAIKLKLLQTSPFRSSLRTKKIKGFDGLFECSVNMGIASSVPLMPDVLSSFEIIALSVIIVPR